MKILIRQIGRSLALVLAAGLASALLARYSPGALVDERELDPRLSPQSIAAMREAREASTNVLAYCLRFASGILQGDLGYSASKDAPIAGLIAQGAPVTLYGIGAGLSVAWGVSFALGVLLSGFGGISRASFPAAAIPDTAAAVLLSVPAALIAYLCLNIGAAAPMVLSLVLVPRLYRYSRSLLTQAYAAPFIEMARARGIREGRILVTHVLPSAGPQLLALAAASLSMAVGAAIPVEVILDTAGLGRLAWDAAMARDIPLLVNLTMLIALATTTAAGLAEAATAGLSTAREYNAPC